jgi:hydrogenase 3 maturation protease
MKWQNAVLEFIADDDRLVILGIGNIQKGDDAAGVACADSLIGKIGKALPSKIKIINGGETPENCTGDIRRFKPTCILIIDAVIAGYKSGTIFIVDPKKIANTDVSTHRMPLSMLCRFLEESIGCRILIIGIEPEKVGLDIRLSKSVQKSIVVIVDFIASFLEPHK